MAAFLDDVAGFDSHWSGMTVDFGGIMVGTMGSEVFSDPEM